MNTVSIAVHNYTGGSIGLYAYGHRFATVTGAAGCVALHLRDTVAVSLGVHRIAEPTVYAQAIDLHSAPYWDLTVERTTRDGAFWPTPARRPCAL